MKFLKSSQVNSMCPCEHFRARFFEAFLMFNKYFPSNWIKNKVKNVDALIYHNECFCCAAEQDVGETIFIVKSSRVCLSVVKHVTLHDVIMRISDVLHVP